MSQGKRPSVRAITKLVSSPLGGFKMPNLRKATAVAPTLLTVHLMHKANVEFQVAVEGEIIVGRDLPDEVVSNIDLAPYDGRKLGVSRNHALIYPKGNLLLIRDLGSFNGTFANNEELFQMRDYPVQDGDVLTFGKLSVRIEYHT